MIMYQTKEQRAKRKDISEAGTEALPYLCSYVFVLMSIK